MHANISTSITLNDAEQPAYNEYVDDYRLNKEAKQLFKCQIIKLAMDFAFNHNLGPIEKFVDWISVNIPKTPEPSYSTQAEEDAKGLVKDYFMEEIVEQLLEDGEASSDYNNDYADGDSTFHETIVDKDYSPKEALELIDDLYEHEEEDSGLWEGQDYRGILSAKAAYTYGNAVNAEFDSLIEEINGIDVDEVKQLAAERFIGDITDELTEDEEDELQNMSPDEQVEWCEEYHLKRFTDAVKDALQNAIEELL